MSGASGEQQTYTAILLNGKPEEGKFVEHITLKPTFRT